MRLLFLIDSLGSGGAQRQIVTIIPLLKQKGVEVEVLCYHEDTFFMDILDKNSVKIHWLLIKNPILRIWKIRSFIRHFHVLLLILLFYQLAYHLSVLLIDDHYGIACSIIFINYLYFIF